MNKNMSDKHNIFGNFQVHIIKNQNKKIEKRHSTNRKSKKADNRRASRPMFIKIGRLYINPAGQQTKVLCTTDLCISLNLF